MLFLSNYDLRTFHCLVTPRSKVSIRTVNVSQFTSSI